MKTLALVLAVGSIATHFLAIWWLSVPLAWMAFQTWSARDEEEQDYIPYAEEIGDE